MGFEVNNKGSNFSVHKPDDEGGKTGKPGNAHNVPVEECRAMANDPNRSHIDDDTYNKLDPDMRACYTPDEENGGYKLTDEVYSVIDKHSADLVGGTHGMGNQV